MSNKTVKILSIIIVTLLYLISLSVALALVYVGLSSLSGLMVRLNIKDMITFLTVVVFFYWIIKTS